MTTNEARPAETGVETALRIAWWNDMRSRGVSQDVAIGKIRDAVAAPTPTPDKPVDLGAMADEIAAYRSDGLWHLEMAEGKGYDSVTAALEAAPPVRKPVDLGADAERGAVTRDDLYRMVDGFADFLTFDADQRMKMRSRVRVYCAMAEANQPPSASVDATIERCAQVAEEYEGLPFLPGAVPALIRALFATPSHPDQTLSTTEGKA